MPSGDPTSSALQLASAEKRILILVVERDPQILAMSNQWRTDHGLKARLAPGQPATPATTEAPGGDDKAKRDPNAVAACRWHGGKALEGFPAKTGQPMTAMGFLAGLDRLQKALPQECTRIKVSAERAEVMSDSVLWPMTPPSP